MADKDTERLAEVTTQAGVGTLRGRGVIHASDRHLELAYHEGDVITFAVNIQGLQVPFSCTAQELADKLDELGVKLPKPSKD